MNEENPNIGIMGQAQLAAGNPATPSVESVLGKAGMGFASEPATSVFGAPKKAEASPLETQFQTVLGMARKAANDAKRRFMAGDNAAPQPQAVTNPTAVPQAAGFGTMDKAFNIQTPTPTPTPQFTDVKPMFGTTASPHYEYNGMIVPLPSDVDRNDTEAVNAAMRENNEIIDLFNDEEEGF